MEEKGIPGLSVLGGVKNYKNITKTRGLCTLKKFTFWKTKEQQLYIQKWNLTTTVWPVQKYKTIQLNAGDHPLHLGSITFFLIPIPDLVWGCIAAASVATHCSPASRSTSTTRPGPPLRTRFMRTRCPRSWRVRSRRAPTPQLTKFLVESAETHSVTSSLKTDQAE